MNPRLSLGLLVSCAALLVSCVSYRIPPEYLPDTELVYLTQNTSLTPIAYQPAAASPYRFEPAATLIDPRSPRFLDTGDWQSLLKPDFQADSRLYREVEAHFNYILSSPELKQLRGLLDGADFELPAPLEPATGEKIRDYQNGAEYQYPLASEATITLLFDGYYEIKIAGQGLFRHQPNGSYERLDADGSVLFAAYPAQAKTLVAKQGYLYRKSPQFVSVSGPLGELAFSESIEAQYQFTPAKDPRKPLYTLFVDQSRRIHSVALTLGNGIRFDFFPRGQDRQAARAMMVKGEQAITITEDYEKIHQRFDTKSHKASELLSIYLPEGIRMTDFTASTPAYAQVVPAWPENYKTKAMGPFDLLYSAKDESALQRLKAERLSKMAETAQRLTGLPSAQRRTLLIPPDLESYRRLMVTQPAELIHWYPSGFATKDIIVMWPVSVPRYQEAQGTDYFFDHEFYAILAHEYVHLLVGQNTGLLNDTPVWLNEGLAVWVETSLSAETKRYWDLCFQVSQGLKRLLDWDLVTLTGTGSLALPQARVHYAQSYALVSVLMQRFGPAKLGEYLRSFRAPVLKASKPDLRAVYKLSFEAVFGMAFDDAVRLLEPAKAG